MSIAIKQADISDYTVIEVVESEETEVVPENAGAVVIVKGEPGEDGFSPDISVEKTENGHKVTVTDKDGQESFDVDNGDIGPVGPQGLPGKTPNIQIGEVVTLEPGTEATASITGTAEEPRLNLGIPQGEPGEGGGAEVTAESIENALGYVPANEEDIPTVPTNVSAFNNDAGYAKTSELPTKTSELSNDSGFITAKDIPAPPEIPVKSVFGRTGTVVAQSGDYTAEMVGADKEGKAVEEVGKHNVDENAHNDIRVELTELRNALEAFLDIDDPTLDQLSELIQKIEANAGTIEQLTNGKINIADIVNNLTTNVANKPLSAAQGVVLKGLVDSLTTVANNATTTAGNAATTANEAKSLANTANTNANSAKTTAQNASDKVDNLEERMDNGEFKGESGADGVSIVSVEQTTTSSVDGGENVVTVTLSNGVKSTFKFKNGSKGSAGAKGNGIKSAVLNADYTLTLTFDDDTELTTPSIRGAQGPAGKDYVLTEADKVEIAGMVGNPILPEYWEEYLPDKIAAIKAKQDEAGKDGFSFVVMADIHYPQNLGKRSPAVAKRIMDECNIRYALVLGDLQSRAPHSTKALAESDFTGAKKMFEPIAEDVFYQKGNHDGSWGNALNGITYPYNFTPEEMHNRIYAPTYKHHNAVTDESGTGYYIDDTANKVRYIMLNTHCNEYAENNDGSAKYNNMSHARFTQSQYDMVVEALSTMPENWAVIVAAHVPINNTYGEAFGDSTNTTGDHVIMRNLLKAYKEKKAYSAEWAGTAGGRTSGGYTNLFSTSGSGFDNQTSKFFTNWLPYNGNDNGGTGTIYHFKGISAGQPYKMNFAMDANGANATSQFYCTAANKQPPTAADYDSNVIIVQHHTPEYKYVRFEIRQALPENLIITANEPIIEATGGGEGYDTVSVEADFTSAKGEMIGYFSGHTHADYVYDAANWWGVSIITTRCDSANENDSTLLAQRVEGTVTEQSFDVFTVNRKTGKLYATKIGAGSDREISY